MKSREEALEWASRIPGSDNEMVEVRRMFDVTDFDPETQKGFKRSLRRTIEPLSAPAVDAMPALVARGTGREFGQRRVPFV